MAAADVLARHLRPAPVAERDAGRRPPGRRPAAAPDRDRSARSRWATATCSSPRCSARCWPPTHACSGSAALLTFVIAACSTCCSSSSTSSRRRCPVALALICVEVWSRGRRRAASRAEPVATASAAHVAGRRRRARLLGQRGDRQRAAGGVLEHLGRLLGRARVELDQQVDDDPVLVVLVEADVGEELARAVVAEGGVGERVARLGARAGLDVVGVDGDRARGDPRRPGDHPLPAVLDRLDAAVVEAEVGLVVHALQALDDRLLHLVDDLAALAALGIDPVDPLVVDLDLEVLRPAAVAPQPAPDLGRALHRVDSTIPP